MTQDRPPSPTPSPERDDDRDALERHVAELTLPLMWSLRQDATRAFEPLDLRPIRVLLLELVARGFTYPKDLAELLETVPTAVSNMLSELESRDLIRRSPDPDDGRRIRLELTQSGHEILAEVRTRWREVTAEALAVLSDDELRTMVQIYQKLLRADAA